MVDRRDKFIAAPGSIEITGLSIPNSLKPVVANAPKDDEVIKVYLARLVKAGKITTDEATFLIDSGAL